VVGAHTFGNQHVVFNNWKDQGQRNAKTLMSILDANAIAPVIVVGRRQGTAASNPSSATPAPIV
jgi:hypothetical protein